VSFSHKIIQDLLRGVFFYLNKNKDIIIKMKPTPRETKEAVERYNFVVEHLIKEGYAQDNESADLIITGMSEEWYITIINE
jgi:hypothetical protein